MSDNQTSHKKLFKARPICQSIYKKYATSRDHRTETSKTKACNADFDCRSCARGADGMIVDIHLLINIMNKALIQRDQCLKDHVFMNA